MRNVFVALLLVSLAAFAVDANLFKLSRIDINPTNAINSDGQVVYAGVGGALNIYNIYQRDYPQLVGTVEGRSSRIKVIIVKEDMLFVLWEKEGLDIFDITDRYSPTPISHFPPSPDARFKSFTAMDIDGNTVFLGGSDFIASLDITNPSSPVLLAVPSLNCAPMDIDFNAGRLYIAAGNMGLGAMLVPNPSQFIFVGSQKGVYTTVKGYRGIILYGRLDEPKPGEPSILGKHLFSFPFQSPMVVDAREDIVFAGGLENFAIYKMLESSKDPQLIWNLPGMPTLDLTLRDDIAYLANAYKGLSAFSISNIEHPLEIGRLETFDVPKRACLVGQELYVSAGVSGVVRVAIANGEHPQILGAFGNDKLRMVWDVQQNSDYIYVLGARDNLGDNVFMEKYDLMNNWIAEYGVANVSKLDPIGEMSFNGEKCAVALGSEGIAILENRFDGWVQSYKITNRSVQFCDLTWQGDLLFASDYHGGYHVYSVGEGMPSVVGFIKTSEEGGNGIVLKDGYLLAADGPKGLTVLDAHNPKNLREANNYPTVWATDIALSGDFAAVSDGQGGVKLFDVSDLPNLELVGDIEKSGYWTHVYCGGNNIYGVDELFGVYIYEIQKATEELAKSDVAPKPQGTTILGAYPNPFNANTGITFTLPERLDADLSIYNITGRKIVTLISDRLPAGTYTLNWKADSSPSGTYFAVLSTPNAQVKEKLLLVK
jgi:hypothetical protein